MKIKIMSGGKGYDINWNEFEVNIPSNFSGTCYVYVDSLEKSLKEDLEKITKIKNIPGLKEITISSHSFKVAEYFNILLKDFKIKKNFDLLNDFKIKKRSEIDFSNLNYNEVTIPFDYMMYTPTLTGITEYNLVNFVRNNIITVSNNKQKAYPEIQEKIYNIISEIFDNLPMEQLNDIDKNILVSNWIQKNIQFIEGRISIVGGKKYICHDYLTNDDKEDIMTIIEKNFGVCNGISKLAVALLSNPKVGCKCNMAHSPGHAYFTQLINEELYMTDNTWCITRNKYHMDGCLKSAKFSTEYLLIGEDKINENEDILSHHARDGIFKGKISQRGISKEKIYQSIEKLKSLGVSFEYSKPPIFVQYEEEKIQTSVIVK